MKKQELIENLKDLRDNYPDNGRHDGVRQGLLIAIGAIQNLEESKKVVIPKFVADWIEEMKQDKRPFYSVMSTLMNKRNHEWAIWKSANMNFSEIVAEAWIDGYEVEKEKLYYIPLGICRGGESPIYLLKTLDGVDVDWSPPEYMWSYKEKYYFTEKEIKEYDARFWPFATEVAEC